MGKLLNLKFISIFLVVSLLLVAGIYYGNQTKNSNVSNDQPQGTEKMLFSVPIGVGEGKLAYTVKGRYDTEVFGPESFAISEDGQVYILDAVDKQVEIFTIKGEYVKTITLEQGEVYSDIEIGAKKLYALTYSGTVLTYEDGKQTTKQKLTDESFQEKFYSLLRLGKNKLGNVVLWNTLDGSVQEIDSGKATSHFNSVTIDFNKQDNTYILATNEQSIIVTYDYNAAGTYPLNITENDELVVLETEALVGEKLYVENRIVKYKNSKKVETALALVTDNYETKVPKKYIYTTKDGRAFQLVNNENAIEIYELYFAEGHHTRIDDELIERVKPVKIEEMTEHFRQYEENGTESEQEGEVVSENKFPCDETNLDNPDGVLACYFSSLLDRDFESLYKYFHGTEDMYEALSEYNANIDETEHVKLLEAYCTLNGGQVVGIHEIAEKIKVSADEYLYKLILVSDRDGELFLEGKIIEFSVKKINGQFKVTTLPPYLN
jgi:hypothetical protein